MCPFRSSKSDCDELSSVKFFNSHLRRPCLSAGPTLMDTQFGSMKHLTRQLPSLATFSVFITWPGSIFPSTGSLNIKMRLYPVAYTVENKHSGTKALILSKFCAVALCGMVRVGGGGGWGRLAKLKTSYLPAEQVNHGWLFFNLSIYLFLLSCPLRNWRKLCKLRNVKKLAFRNLRNVHNVHNTPCLSTELFTFPRKNLGERVQTKCIMKCN